MIPKPLEVLGIIAAIITPFGSTHSLIYESQADPIYSCSHAIHMSTQQSCADLCEAKCGFQVNSKEAWGAAALDCFDSLPDCLVPIGYQTSLKPSLVQRRTLHADLWDYDRFFDRVSNEHRGRWFSGDHLRYHTYQAILTFPAEIWVNAMINPYKLAWATLKITGPDLVGDDRMCSYVEFVHYKPLSLGVPPSLEDWVPLPIRGMNLGHGRDGSFAAHMANRISMVGPNGTQPTHFTPSIASLIQQWYLATNGKADMNLSLILYQDADLRKAPSPNWNEYEFSLEMMTTFDWRGSLNGDCLHYNTCWECARELNCHWCDLSQVWREPGMYWASSQAASLSSLRESSACGISPLACHFLGGISFKDKCPKEWKATFD